MTPVQKKTASELDRQMVIVRIINAPRERVWEAVTDPKQVGLWWGPSGFTNTLVKHELKAGGVWEHVMHGPDGKDYPNRAVFKEIVKPERLVFELTGGKKDDPVTTKTASWTLEARGDKTQLTLCMTFITKEQRDLTLKAVKAIDGGNQTIDRLIGHLGVKPAFELTFERLLDAPREKVWDAWVDPEKLSKWGAPKPFQNVVKTLELREGGKFDIAMRTPDGKEFGMNGTLRVVLAPMLLVSTGQFAGGPADQATRIIHLEEEDGKTRLRVRQTFHVSSPAIEGAMKGGAEANWKLTLDQLEEFVKQ